MEAAFVGESVLEADQSASYSDVDSTLPFEEEKNNPTDEKIPGTEEQTPEKTDSENKILTWMDLYQETLLLRTKRRQSSHNRKWKYWYR